MDPRFKKINRLLTEYALGNFARKLRISSRLDEVDAFITCVNMVGEELKHTTISKNHFNNIFNSVSDMIFVLDTKGKIHNTSNSVHELLKYPAERFEGKFIDTLEVKRAHSLFLYITTNLKKKKGPAEIETSFKTKEGRVIPVLCTSTFLYNEKKKKAGYLVVAKDLSNIKEYELSLKESEEKYRKIFEETGDCIFITDKKGNFIELNKAGYRLFRISGPVPPGFNLVTMISKPDARKNFRQLIQQEKLLDNFFAQISCPDGTLAECLISLSVMEDHKKKPVGYRGIIKDISKQRETENLILKTIVNTQEAERMRFAKDIHDSLGQQLSAIKFYIGTSVDSTHDARQKGILVKSNDALVKALADMRNICFNLMPKTLESFGLAAALKELGTQTEVKGRLAILIKDNNSFPQLNKQLEIALFRVVQEFINNSIKHSRAGRINIELSGSKNMASIILKDNGTGFSITESIGSKGMGLKNVQSRLQPYGVDVLITSAPGSGTRYKIIIPINNSNSLNKS
ncbi:MAG: PAS domain S-box protein [Ferruginibacter sp.]